MEIKYIYYLINNKIILCIYNIEYEKVNKYFRIFIQYTCNVDSFEIISSV